MQGRIDHPTHAATPVGLSLDRWRHGVASCTAGLSLRWHHAPLGALRGAAYDRSRSTDVDVDVHADEHGLILLSRGLSMWPVHVGRCVHPSTSYFAIRFCNEVEEKQIKCTSYSLIRQLGETPWRTRTRRLRPDTRRRRSGVRVRAGNQRTETCG